MGRAIGIDFGTTRSVVAFWGPGERILRNAEGDDSTPSVVCVHRGRLFVGRPALELMPSCPPQDTIVSVKQLLGRSADHPHVQQLRKSCPYPLVPAGDDGGDDDVCVVLAGKKFSPVQVAALILEKLKADAERELREAADEVVMTVPASFDEMQREATCRAAELAGLKVLRLVDEPLAVALALGIESGLDDARPMTPHTTLVYRLGGGSFDASVISFRDGVLFTRAMEWDARRGADAFDQCIVAFVLDQLAAKGVQIVGAQPSFMARLRLEAERAKRALSDRERTVVHATGWREDLHGDLVSMEVEFTRYQFEALVWETVAHTVALVRAAIDRAGMTADKIDTVAMVGGGAQIPLVRLSLAELFREEQLRTHADPLRCAALGAAVLAARFHARAEEDPAAAAGTEPLVLTVHQRTPPTNEQIALFQAAPDALGFAEAERLMSRASDQAAAVIRALNASAANPRALREGIAELESCMRAAVEARRLAPTASGPGQLLDRIQGAIADLEHRCSVIEASAAARREDWATAVTCLQRAAAVTSSVQEREAFRKDLAVCLGNRAISNLTAALKWDKPSLVRPIIEANRDLTEALSLDPANAWLIETLARARDLREKLGLRHAPPARRLSGGLGWLRRLFGRHAETPRRVPTADSTAATRTRGNPEVPGGLVDRVHFSVTAPLAVLPCSAFVLNVWAHLEKHRAEVVARAREAAGGGAISVQSKGPVALARGSVLTVYLELPDLIVAQPHDTILWEGEVGNANFAVTVPSGMAPGEKGGMARILVDGLQLARVGFVIRVCGEATGRVARLEMVELRHRTAFASYATADRDQVLARVQGIQKAVPDMDVFVDVLQLRSGQDWEQRIWREIPSRDVFYLFWSQSARDSRWVEKEWHCALAARGLDFIDPVPLVSPDEAPPPPELAGKHFNDWTLAFMRGHKARGPVEA